MIQKEHCHPWGRNPDCIYHNMCFNYCKKILDYQKNSSIGYDWNTTTVVSNLSQNDTLIFKP